MNEAETLLKVKACFGCYEDFPSSWHCVACPIQHECEAKTKEKENE